MLTRKELLMRVLKVAEMYARPAFSIATEDRKYVDVANLISALADDLGLPKEDLPWETNPNASANDALPHKEVP